MTVPFIPDEEFAQRRKRVQEAVRAASLDALLVHSNEADFANVRYLSDYWPIFETAGVLVPAEGEAAPKARPLHGTGASCQRSA